MLIDFNAMEEKIIPNMRGGEKEAGMRAYDDGLCKIMQGRLIPGATVICAVGQRSNRDDVLLLRGCAPWVREIGDCVRVSNITNAMYMAYHAGLDI